MLTAQLRAHPERMRRRAHIHGHRDVLTHAITREAPELEPSRVAGSSAGGSRAAQGVGSAAAEAGPGARALRGTRSTLQAAPSTAPSTVTNGRVPAASSGALDAVGCAGGHSDQHGASRANAKRSTSGQSLCHTDSFCRVQLQGIATQPKRPRNCWRTLPCRSGAAC